MESDTWNLVSRHLLLDSERFGAERTQMYETRMMSGNIYKIFKIENSLLRLLCKN